MVLIRLKIKNIFYLCICLSFICMCYLLALRVHNKPKSGISIYGEGSLTQCNPSLKWVTESSASQDVIGILGAPGSGEIWLRQLIEQVSGFYTGSVYRNLTKFFVAEGRITNVVGVLGHDVESMPPISSAIVIVRSLKDSVRTQFSQQQEEHNFNDAPLQTYYGTKWLKFAQQASRQWIDRYNSYVDINIPLLIVNYENLLDTTQLQSTLLRITNQLHVPIKRSVLECLVQTAESSPFKPKPLKPLFQPFDLLPRLDVIKLEQAETRVMARLQEAHLKFRPKV